MEDHPSPSERKRVSEPGPSNSKRARSSASGITEHDALPAAAVTPRTKKHKAKAPKMVKGIAVLVTHNKGGDQDNKSTHYCLLSDSNVNTLWLVDSKDKAPQKIRAADFNIVADGKVYGPLSQRSELVMNRQEEALSEGIAVSAEWTMSVGGNKGLESLTMQPVSTQLQPFEGKGEKVQVTMLPSEVRKMQFSKEAARGRGTHSQSRQEKAKVSPQDDEKELEDLHRFLNRQGRQDNEEGEFENSRKWLNNLHDKARAVDVGWKVSLELLREILEGLSGAHTDVIFRFVRALNATTPEKVKQLAGEDVVARFQEEEEGRDVVGGLRNFVVGTAFEILRKMTHAFHGKTMPPLIVKDQNGDEIELVSDGSYVSEAPAWTGMGVQPHTKLHDIEEVNELLQRHLKDDECFDVVSRYKIKGTNTLVFVGEQCKHRRNAGAHVSADKFISSAGTVQEQLWREHGVRMVLMWTTTTATLPRQLRESTCERKEEWAGKRDRMDLIGINLNSLDMEYSTPGLIDAIHNELTQLLLRLESRQHTQSSNHQRQQPVEMSRFQGEMCDRVVKVYKKGTTRMTAVKPTGTGKTLAASFCLHRLEKKYPEKFRRPSLVVCPRIRLAEQFHNSLLANELARHPERVNLRYYLYCSGQTKEEDVSCGYMVRRINSRDALVEKLKQAVRQMNKGENRETYSYRFFTTYQSGKSFYLAAREAARELGMDVKEVIGLFVRDEAHLACGPEYKPFCSILKLHGAFNLSLTATPRFYNIRRGKDFYTPTAKEYDDLFPQPRMDGEEEGEEGEEEEAEESSEGELPFKTTISDLLHDGAWDHVPHSDFLKEMAQRAGEANMVLQQPPNGTTVWKLLKETSKQLGIGLVALQLEEMDDGIDIKLDEAGEPLVLHNNKCGEPSSDFEGDVYIVGVLPTGDQKDGQLYIQQQQTSEPSSSSCQPQQSDKKKVFHCMSGRVDIDSGHGKIEYYVTIPEAHEAERIVDMRLCMLDVGEMAQQWYTDQPQREMIQCTLPLEGMDKPCVFTASAHEIASIKGLLDGLAGLPFEGGAGVRVKMNIATPIMQKCRRCLVFCENIPAARRYLAVLLWLLQRDDCPLSSEDKKELYCSLVYSQCTDGSSMSYEEQTERLTKLRASKLGVMFNCQLLGIGYDLPGIDTVMFADPCQSTEKFLQGLGRALRWDYELGYSKIATVILPCYDPEMSSDSEDDEEEEEEPSPSGLCFHEKFDCMRRVLECMTDPALKVLGQVLDLVGPQSLRGASIHRGDGRKEGHPPPSPTVFDPEEMQAFINHVRAVVADLEYGKADAAFLSRVEAYTAWLVSHDGRPPRDRPAGRNPGKRDLTADEEEEKKLGKWKSTYLPRVIKRSGGQAKYRDKYLRRAEALDAAEWWEWPAEDADPDAAFLSKVEAYTAWLGSHEGRPPRGRPAGINPGKRDLTAEEEEEEGLGRWKNHLLSDIKKAGGQAKYRDKYPGRAKALDAAEWWDWDPDADAPFLSRVEAYTAWLADHEGRPPRQQPAGKNARKRDLTVEEEKERKLGKWKITTLPSEIKKAGGQAKYRDKYPGRAKALNAAEWFVWPAEDAANQD